MWRQSQILREIFERITICNSLKASDLSNIGVYYKYKAGAFLSRQYRALYKHATLRIHCRHLHSFGKQWTQGICRELCGSFCADITAELPLSGYYHCCVNDYTRCKELILSLRGLTYKLKYL